MLAKTEPGVGGGGNAGFTVAKDQLRSYVERIENLEETKAEISSDIKDVFEQANSSGFDKKALRAVIKMRKQDKEEREQLEGIVATYALALGMAE